MGSYGHTVTGTSFLFFLCMCVCLLFKVPMTLFPPVVRKDTEAQTPSEMHENHFKPQTGWSVRGQARKNKGPPVEVSGDL